MFPASKIVLFGRGGGSKSIGLKRTNIGGEAK
ncbi:unnamed protein product [Chondrus crispus]|uniref:Uncharacterized protein n=1 Tax=Chondrus crispus TaxID=2769 RepID=R7QC91_CHOCR|nr:unnamed protein product [Chondrus crispus]CDF35075.1 unnamed protein product [Chondrus crispus]|eukprot:XP_005714894.1 unnamed protein product [Chondrus crispus]